jgi:hypothetical protein
MRKKLVGIILVLLFIPLCLPETSLGEVKRESSIQPLYTHILQIDGSFNISNGKAACYGAGRSQFTDTKTIVKVTLQKRVTGSTVWSSVCSWSDTQSGRTYAIVNEQKSISRGYDYRILIKCTITDSEGVIQETDSMYSRVISY